MERALWNDAKPFERDAKDPWVRLSRSCVGRGDDRRENVGQPELLEPRVEGQVEVRDNPQSESATPQPFKRLVHAGQDFEVHRADVEGCELAGVEAIRAGLVEEDSGALALEGR